MFNQADPTFGCLWQTLDARMKQLTASGVGTVAKRAQAISKDEEALWIESVFNVDSAQGLTYLVFFFYDGKLFGMQGWGEHRELCQEQFVIGHDNAGRYLQFMGI